MHKGHRAGTATDRNEGFGLVIADSTTNLILEILLSSDLYFGVGLKVRIIHPLLIIIALELIFIGNVKFIR